MMIESIPIRNLVPAAVRDLAPIERIAVVVDATMAEESGRPGYMAAALLQVVEALAGAESDAMRACLARMLAAKARALDPDSCSLSAEN